MTLHSPLLARPVPLLGLAVVLLTSCSSRAEPASESVATAQLISATRMAVNSLKAHLDGFRLDLEYRGPDPEEQHPITLIVRPPQFHVMFVGQ